MEGLESLRVRNLEAFEAMLLMFKKIDDDKFKLEVLNRILMVFSGHPDNYWLLSPLHATPALINGLPYYSEQLQSMVLKILDYVIEVVQAVPFQELTALSVVLMDLGSRNIADKFYRSDAKSVLSAEAKRERLHRITATVLDTVRKYVHVDRAYSEVVGKCGLLDVMFHHVKILSRYLTETAGDATTLLSLTSSKNNVIPSPKLKPPSPSPPPPPPDDADAGTSRMSSMEYVPPPTQPPPDASTMDETPILLDRRTYKKMSGALTLILEDAKNLALFRDSDTHDAVMGLTNFQEFRPEALRILSVPADERGLGDMMELLNLTRTGKNERSTKSALLFLDSPFFLSFS